MNENQPISLPVERPKKTLHFKKTNAAMFLLASSVISSAVYKNKFERKPENDDYFLEQARLKRERKAAKKLKQ